MHLYIIFNALSVMMAELLWLPCGTLNPSTPVLLVWFDPKWLPLVPGKPQCGFLQSRGRRGPDSRRLVQAGLLLSERL